MRTDHPRLMRACPLDILMRTLLNLNSATVASESGPMVRKVVADDTSDWNLVRGVEPIGDGVRSDFLFLHAHFAAVYGLAEATVNDSFCGNAKGVRDGVRAVG